MEINATLIAQVITFVIFIMITMKYIWPPLVNALNERQEKIADGLASAERGRHELELAQHKVTEQLRDAKLQAAEILDGANKRAGQVVEEAKVKARDEGKRLAELAKEEIQQEVNNAKQKLRQHVATLAITGAERILLREIDEAANSKILDDIISEV